MAIPLFKIPKKLEEADIQDDSVLPAYQESIKSLNPKVQETLNRYTSIEGQLAHSSPLMQIHLQTPGILPKDTRLATRADLQTALANDETGEFLRGRYTDFGIALFTPNDSYEPNKPIAEKLGEQLKKKIGTDRGLLVPFSALNDSENPGSFYGLTLDISPEILDMKPEDVREVIHDLGSYKWDYTRGEGIACAGLSDGVDWLAGSENLRRSNVIGRVVVVRAAGTREDLEQRLTDYKASQEQARAEYISKLQALRNEMDAELTSAK
jgi:hypothetical protein